MVFLNRGRHQRETPRFAARGWPRLLILGVLAGYFLWNPGRNAPPAARLPQGPAEPEHVLTVASAPQAVEPASQGDIAVSNEQEPTVPENEPSQTDTPTADVPQAAPDVSATDAAEVGPADRAEGPDGAADEGAMTEEELRAREDGQLADLLSMMKDGSLRFQSNEMPAYWQLMHRVKTRSAKEMGQLPAGQLRFNELFQDAKKHRGELLRLTVNVRRVLSYDVTTPNQDGIRKIYEVWGWTDEARAWMYVLLTPELPPGIPEGEFVQRRATFTGYFVKLQGYHPGGAEPNAKPLLAPLFIGRFTSAPPPVAQSASLLDGAGFWIAIGGLIVVLALVFIIRMRLSRRRPPTVLKVDREVDDLLKELT